MVEMQCQISITSLPISSTNKCWRNLFEVLWISCSKSALKVSLFFSRKPATIELFTISIHPYIHTYKTLYKIILHNADLSTSTKLQVHKTGHTPYLLYHRRRPQRSGWCRRMRSGLTWASGIACGGNAVCEASATWSGLCPGKESHVNP